jgi:hypothetical protein
MKRLVLAALTLTGIAAAQSPLALACPADEWMCDCVHQSFYREWTFNSYQQQCYSFDDYGFSYDCNPCDPQWIDHNTGCYCG